MIFRSKVDGFFVTFMSIVILLIGAVTLLPPLIDNEASTAVVIIMTAICIIVAGSLLWMSFSIKYIFYDNYLLVKGGPLKSKIPYQSIRKISPTTDIFTGYRILSARNGLELFYDAAILGSVKISPKYRREFITELKKRCPNVHIQE
ncbi:PH domain-containing protein [Oceanobacillus locisalsi]|uniref:PH domain-containing protein n=1 Tax=Oceanobacillus locisalsi TaxID=546107 RepID=A0ABW3NN06_9BACI